jgi:hypothetical protein
MPDEQEYLLYPIDTGEDPVCLHCEIKMLLAREGKPTLLIFRCARCGQSEKFLCED